MEYNIELVMRDIEQVQDMLKALYEDTRLREEHEELANTLEDVKEILDSTYKTLEEMDDDNNENWDLEDIRGSQDYWD